MGFASEETTEITLAARFAVNILVTARDGADRVTWARRIHDRSERQEGPFVAVSAQSPPGRGRQADDVDGWFERAAGGTLFIDRVGELCREAQARLLSRLADQRRHAAPQPDPGVSDRVRVIAGTDRPISSDVAVGTFSDVLFYRLNVVHIDLMHEPGEEVMKVRDIMSTPPHACLPESDLASVAKIMWDQDCGFIPVVDAAGTVCGVVTDRDICIAAATRRLAPEQISAAQAMTGPIHACRSEDSINEALSAMRQFRIRRLPVVDAAGRLQGVISVNDIVLASNETRQPKATDVLGAMAAICAHHQVQTAPAYSGSRS